MNSQQNLQVPSLKFCMVEGHQNQISTKICLYDKCGLNNRWICIKCVLQKKHSHNLEGDNHIVDSEMFYKLLKDKRDQIFKQIKEISERITSFIKKMKILVDDINNILQQLEKENTAISNNKNLQLIGQMIKVTEEDFSKVSNEQIVEFLDLSMSSNAFLYQDFKLNLIRINQNISDIIADVDKNYCSDQLLEKTQIKKEDLQNSQNMNDSDYKKQQENGEIKQNNIINKDEQQINNNIEIQQMEKKSLSREESPYIQNSLPAQIKVTKQEEDEGEWEDYDGEDHNQCQDNHYQNQEAHQIDPPLIINQTAGQIKGMKEQEDDEGEWEDYQGECEADDKQEKQDQPQIPTSNPVIYKPTTEPQFNLLNNKIDQAQETQVQVPSKKRLFDYIFKKV